MEKQEISEKIYAKAGELQKLIDEAKALGLATDIRTMGFESSLPIYVIVSETITYKANA